MMRPSYITSFLVVVLVAIFASDIVAVDRAFFILLITGVLAVGIVLDLANKDQQP